MGPITTLVQEQVMKQVQKTKEPRSPEEKIRDSSPLQSPSSVRLSSVVGTRSKESSVVGTRSKDPQIEVAVQELRREVKAIQEQLDEFQMSTQKSFSASDATISYFK